MLIILTGKSGSGKDSVLNELVNEYDAERIVTATTRPMREGETDGIDYHFKTNEEFEKLIESGEVFEHRAYNTLVEGKPDTWYYGSLKQELDPDKDYVTVVDMQGANDYINAYGKENCFVVNITVDDKVREERAMERGSFDKTEWDRRVADDNVKFSDETMRGIVNFSIDNTYSGIDEATYAIVEALESFKSVNRSDNEHYIVVAGWHDYSYYEEPECRFVTYRASNLDRMIKEENFYTKLVGELLEENKRCAQERTEKEAFQNETENVTSDKLQEYEPCGYHCIFAMINLEDENNVIECISRWENGEAAVCIHSVLYEDGAVDVGIDSDVESEEAEAIALCVEETMKEIGETYFNVEFERDKKKGEKERD
jgi:guanylate kinase